MEAVALTDAELETLCRDRPLLTRELHGPNAFYGHADLLRRYAGWERGPLKAAIEHGIYLDDDVWDIDAGTALPLYLCPSPRRAELFSRATRGRTAAEPIGPLVRYAAAASEQAAPAGRTLLAFPAHSTHHVDVQYDAERFADLLESARADFDAVLVCLYWRDVERGTAGVFRARGFECTTAGHIFRQGFLERLVRIVCASSAVVTNEIGTHIPYSVLLGRPVWLAEQEVEYTAESDAALQASLVPDWEHPNIVAMRRLFSERTGSLTGEQVEWVDDLTGAAHLKEPEEIAALLGRAEEDWRRVPKPTRLRAVARARARYLRDRMRS